MFPANSVFCAPVDQLPVHPNSSTYINTIGSSTQLHVDFGTMFDGYRVGYTVNMIPPNQPQVPVELYYGDESDPSPYPIPPNADVEGSMPPGPNVPPGSDRHLFLLQPETHRMYELGDMSSPAISGSIWSGGAGVKWDLDSNNMRPDGWTSSDAAGLPIVPFLIKPEELQAGVINHPLRFSTRQTQRRYLWPASHYASSLTGSQYAPMGLTMRLKSGFNISGFSPDVQIALRALKKYGMILADNGGNMYIQGYNMLGYWSDADYERWVVEFRRLRTSDFEAVSRTDQFAPNSYRVTTNGGSSASSTSSGDNTPSQAAFSHHTNSRPRAR